MNCNRSNVRPTFSWLPGLSEGGKVREKEIPGGRKTCKGVYCVKPQTTRMEGGSFKDSRLCSQDYIF